MQIKFKRTPVDVAKPKPLGVMIPSSGRLGLSEVNELRRVLGLPAKQPPALKKSGAPLPFADIQPPAPRVPPVPVRVVPVPRAPAPASAAEEGADSDDDDDPFESFSMQELYDRRIDPNDGKPYTRAEFKSYYGSAGHDMYISSKYAQPCTYFAAGTCSNASDCRFRHAQPKKARKPTPKAVPSPAPPAAPAPPAPPALPAPSAAVSAVPRSQPVRGIDIAEGFVFVMLPAVLEASMRELIVGAKADQLSVMQAIGSRTRLFLHNTQERRLHGIFLATAPPALNIDPHFLGGSFPAQVNRTTVN